MTAFDLAPPQPAGEADPVQVSSPAERFRSGGVIPAHPLALDRKRRLDETRQRALSRYQIEAGALGLAVAVHSTQFGIHDKHADLLDPVLALAAETAAEYPDRAPILIAGIAGPTHQAVQEAELAASLGYDMVLISNYGVDDSNADALLDRARAVSEVLPTIGFYLQAAIGGPRLDREYWTRLSEIPNVIGVKAAPFDRYATLEVVHGIARSRRRNEIALYTGNDDNIVLDLLTTFPSTGPGGLAVTVDVVGGLLGQWALWAQRAVEMFELARAAKAGDDSAMRQLLDLNPALTDANGVIFDARHGFAGCIPGIHEILRRQGLLEHTLLLDEAEGLSPGQMEEIDRIWRAYPQLRDDEFVEEHRDRWLR